MKKRTKQKKAAKVPFPIQDRYPKENAQVNLTRYHSRRGK